MKTTLDLPEDLLREARELTSVKTKRGLVIRALEELVRRRRIERLFERAGRREFRLDNADLDSLRHAR
jgi:Arc/MetJ family transcription regulator